MDRRTIDDDLPLVEFFLDDVLRNLESRRTNSPRKVSRRTLIVTYVQTHDPQATAHVLNVSTSLVYQIMAKAVYAARRRAALWPGPEFTVDE